MTRRRRDPIAAFNERVKLLANTFNAVGLGVIGYALLRPLIDDPVGWQPLFLIWAGTGLAFHAAAHYILTWISKDGDL